MQTFKYFVNLYSVKIAHCVELDLQSCLLTQLALADATVDEVDVKLLITNADLQIFCQFVHC